MKVITRINYTLRPDEAQAAFIIRNAGCARHVYNGLLVRLNKKIENGEPWKIDKVSDLYEESPFLKEADSLSLANARLDLGTALKKWIEPANDGRKGKKAKRPRLKRKGKCKEAYTTNNQTYTAKDGSTRNTVEIVDGKRVKVPKLKDPIPLDYDRPLPKGCRVRSATLYRRADGVFKISFCVEYETDFEERPFEGVEDLRVVGLDMSLNEFAVSSDPEDRTHGTYVRQNRMFRRRLARLQRRVSRKKLVPTGTKYYSRKWQYDAPAKVLSKNREKARMRHARLSQCVANRRKDFVVKLAR